MSHADDVIAKALNEANAENKLLRRQLCFAQDTADRLLLALDSIGAKERTATGRYMHARQGNGIWWDRLDKWPKKEE